MGWKNSIEIRRVALVALILALAVCLRSYRLGHENFWIDEVAQIQVASQSVADILENYRPDATRAQRGIWSLRTSEQAPLSPLITHFFLSADEPEYHARIPSVVFSSLGVLGLFAFARLFVSFPTALLAMTFLAISPLDIWYSQEARWYAQWSFVTTLSYIALVRAGRSRSLAPWVGYSLATVANLYTFVFSVFVIFPQALSLAWRRWRGWASSRTVAKFAAVLLVALILTLPVTRMVLGNLEQARTGTPRSSSWLELPYSFLSYSVGFTIGPTLSELHAHPGLREILSQHLEVIVVLAVFAPLALVGLMRVRQQEHLASWLLPWLVVPAVSVFIAALVVPDVTYQVRYSIASLPAFQLLLAIGVLSLRKQARWVGICAVAALSSYSISNFYWQEVYDKADLRGAIAYVRSVEAGPAQITVTGQIRIAMPYYGDHPDLEVVFGCGSQAGSIGEIDRARRIWLVSGRDWDRKSSTRRCLSLLSDSYQPSERITFPGVEVWRLEPRASATGDR